MGPTGDSARGSSATTRSQLGADWCSNDTLPIMKIGLSDNLVDVIEITSTDAARAFRDLLDRVEQTGESFRITRHGRAIAELSPIGTGSVAAMQEFLLQHHARYPEPDENWWDDISWVRERRRPIEDPWDR